MTIWWLVLILASLGSIGIAFVWLAARVGDSSGSRKPDGTDSMEEAANLDVEHIFDE